MPRIDVHQHIWTTPLLKRLAARREPPLVRHTDGLTVLHSAGEQPYVIDLDAAAPEARAGLVRDDDLDLALIAISSPIGIEALAREEALELIDAHLEGVAALPGEFAAWGPIALDRADPDDVDSLLARGCVGISIPAGALAGAEALADAGVVLERIAARGVPLFVHPGRGRAQQPPEIRAGEPPWWRALTDYVAQMQAAWLTLSVFGRREHPELTVVFAMLAGCAPLHSERLLSRRGPAIELHYPHHFYETSSYGSATVETIAERVGEGQLMYGSDRPVIDPVTTGLDVVLQENAGRLLAGARA